MFASLFMTAAHAPGCPGIAPRWSSSRKEGVGTAGNALGRIWFTLSHGIINEIYYPRLDRPCTRDLELIVTDGREFFSEEKRDADSRTAWLAPGVPAFEVTNTCRRGRYEITKQILAHPERHALLQRTRFRPRQGRLEDYQLYALLAPHLHNCGVGNTAWVGEFKGTPMLMAQHDGAGLALASSAPWLKRSAGFVGISDGWQDLRAHKRMAWEYGRAERGNVALTGEIDLAACAGEFLLVAGFGRSAAEAAHRARAALIQGFNSAWKQYREEWEAWQNTLRPLRGARTDGQDAYRISAAVIRTHEAKDFPGGTIASLSIPWGEIHGDNDPGGYHLVWPRDAYESCGAMLAAGAGEEARRALSYFEITQEADGHWPQNMWLEGTPFWPGLQLDETAAPILLLDLARRENLLEAPEDRRRLWPMVRQAAIYLVRNGPSTGQDRWEENAGYTPYTLATEIAALVVAADLAAQHGESSLGTYFRETADAWNEAIESWLYATGTALARRFGVEGYYARITPRPFSALAAPEEEIVHVANRPADQQAMRAVDLISADALALVRFGLRAPDDPRIVNTIKVIDGLLKVETPRGPVWRRYTQDGYGEHPDGAPFDGAGIGRAWPLLTGERAHYELAAGRPDEARRLLLALEAFADDNGMIPEQVWDAEDRPERELRFGRPSGSARPLVWAHAEHIKLLRSLREGSVFDQPPQTTQRYLREKVRSPLVIWRFQCQTRRLPQGRGLRLEALAPARIRWTANQWAEWRELETRDTGAGIHLADLPTQPLAAGTRLEFTFFWTEANRWEGKNFELAVVGPK